MDVNNKGIVYRSGKGIDYVELNHHWEQRRPTGVTILDFAMPVSAGTYRQVFERYEQGAERSDLVSLARGLEGSASHSPPEEFVIMYFNKGGRLMHSAIIEQIINLNERSSSKKSSRESVPAKH